MRLVAGFIVALAVVALFGRFIKRAAPLLYVLALILDIVYIGSVSYGMPPWVRAYMLFIMQSNTLAMGFFIIVMYTGVLSEGSSLRRFLLSIRAELSIIASILCVGHVFVYGHSYLDQLLVSASVLPALRLAATLVALLLVVLLIPLAITSVKAIRVRMEPQVWKRLQRLAYLFFLLIFVHILFYLAAPALAGSTGATFSLCLYMILGILYVVLRVRMHSGEKGRGRKGRYMQPGGDEGMA
jgi:DMSO/TMAO reductase YedYZ heme-binding membrane subunit